MEKKRKYYTYMLLAVFGIVIIAIIMLVRNHQPPPQPLPVQNPVESQTTPEPAGDVADASPEPVATPAPEVTKAPPTPNPNPPVEATPEKTPMDPEDQPREHFVIELADISSLPEGYTLDNLQLTDKGIQLMPPKPGEENTPRFGVLESPPEEMVFPGNAISPFWKENLPENTSVFVEVAVSPDGENWSLWNTVMPDTDMASGDEAIGEFRQDGSVNPYYGYTPGGVFFWGMRLYKYFKFRVNLYSETPDSPTLSGFRVFYQDSTLGQGHLAEVNVLEGTFIAPSP